MRSRFLLPLTVCIRSCSKTPIGKRCYYSVLDVPVTATPEDVRTAYYAKCKSTHPDVTATDSQAFLEVNEAYNVLIDPEQRRLYDGNRGIIQTPPYRGDGNDDNVNDEFQTPHFSCSPYGPKVSFNRASEIFHSRKFRRKYSYSNASWTGIPRARSFDDESAAKERSEREDAYCDYYNRRNTNYGPSIARFLLFTFSIGTFAAVVLSYDS